MTVPRGADEVDFNRRVETILLFHRQPVAE